MRGGAAGKDAAVAARDHARNVDEGRQKMEPNRAAARSAVTGSPYFREIRKFPMLSADSERALGQRWRDHQDISAAHRLVNSHLRLVVKTAGGFRAYGMPAEELIAEGHVGLMRALRGFDPDRGVRFSTYAVWWVRAAIQEYILRNWSLVKIGTTTSQKRLFFNLRRVRARLHDCDDGHLSADAAARIAHILCVPESEVVSMSCRLSGPDCSLDAPIAEGGESSWQSLLVDPGRDQESVLADCQQAIRLRTRLPAALEQLTARERHIVAERYFKEQPATLEALSVQYGVSRERIRQIEAQAMTKLRRSVQAC
jgi:RNA polymerase sigma-32 factor